MVDYETIDPRYGMTVDQWLIDTEVVRGLEQFGPWVGANGEPALFDPDDLDNGTDHFGAPSDALYPGDDSDKLGRQRNANPIRRADR